MKINEDHNRVKLFYQHRLKRLSITEDEKITLIFSLLAFFKCIVERQQEDSLESQTSYEVERIENLLLNGNKEYFEEEIRRLEIREKGNWSSPLLIRQPYRRL